MDLLETLGQSLARATEGTAPLSVQPMDRSAVPPGCANATQMRTATVAQCRTTAYGAGSVGALQASVASALAVDASLVSVCRTDGAAAAVRRRRALLQLSPTPTATAAATPEPTAQATGTVTPYDANPFSPTPTPALGTGEADMAVYVGNVDPSREGAVGQQLQALFATSELPVLQGITPPLRQVPPRPTPSQAAEAVAWCPRPPPRSGCCALAEWSNNTHPQPPGGGGGQGSIAMAVHCRRKPPPLTPQTKVTIVGQNEICNGEDLVGPFLVRTLLGPRARPPPPPSNASGAGAPPSRLE